MRLRLLRTAAVLAIGIQGLWTASFAQSYPDRAIRLVVPYPPGGSTDFIARLYAEGLSREIGQAVVVDNRPGAATNIGSEAVAKAKPDGYTVLFGGGGPTLNNVFGPKPSFDPLSAMDPVSLIARVPFMVAANPKTPFGTAQQMIAAAKATPGKYSISSAQLNVYVELLKARSKVNVLHIPYKGGAQAATDAVAGQVDMVFALVPVLLPQVQTGKLKALGVTSGKRLNKLLPNVSTFTELGVDYDIGVWYGLQAPAGTPAAILERLKEATHKVVGQAAFVDKLAAGGAEATSSQPAEMRKLMVDQQSVWEKLAVSAPELLLTESK
ncbi:MAG: hypothetical protein EOP81_01105 [Variovorax sp.]|nr:MAG: hypothetical protein EOP81_01105 [Variovorax sp.]